ncbi:ABC transporter ATP-binding protein [Alicyclobacillus dauci]|uniref:ABC transporter ATP-binding protein n=1 Tax=Alicyclobacillus dauci TaxID=1475485 RepID=A0ABY6Z1L9_9BACL|nr:ABC transporter ATP-binding protein [Alicyclobacillus dauci]WAH36721.1 ABC transporter ATP-binding protein [Alicyclobacillus dauci]
MAEPAVFAKGLTKEYTNGKGCHDIHLTLPNGEVFGLLGPNGAGKSTFVKMLVGLLHKTAGEVKVFGLPPGRPESRRKIGYLPELFRFQDWLTGYEVLQFHARLAGVDKSAMHRQVDRVLELVGLGDRRTERVRSYSKGMQQRLGLACALVGDPQLIILDEPVSALDPGGRHEVRSILTGLRDEGKTVLLNTHLLEDVEAVCSTVGLLSEGKLQAHGRVDDILHKGREWIFTIGGMEPDLLLQLGQETGVRFHIESVVDEVTTLVGVIDEPAKLGYVNDVIHRLGMTIYTVSERSGRLENWFLQLTSTKGH